MPWMSVESCLAVSRWVALSCPVLIEGSNNKDYFSSDKAAVLKYFSCAKMRTSHNDGTALSSAAFCKLGLYLLTLKAMLMVLYVLAVILLPTSALFYYTVLGRKLNDITTVTYFLSTTIYCLSFVMIQVHFIARKKMFDGFFKQIINLQKGQRISQTISAQFAIMSTVYGLTLLALAFHFLYGVNKIYIVLDLMLKLSVLHFQSIIFLLTIMLVLSTNFIAGSIEMSIDPLQQVFGRIICGEANFRDIGLHSPHAVDSCIVRLELVRQCKISIDNYFEPLILLFISCDLNRCIYLFCDVFIRSKDIDLNISNASVFVLIAMNFALLVSSQHKFEEKVSSIAQKFVGH